MTVRQFIFAALRSKAQQVPGKEALLELVNKHVAKQKDGPRRGWQVKAATWVKKLHVDRGDVKVGRAGVDGRFQIAQELRPRYMVPAGLASFELKPYVQIPGVDKPKVKEAVNQASDEDGK